MLLILKNRSDTDFPQSLFSSCCHRNLKTGVFPSASLPEAIHLQILLFCFQMTGCFYGLNVIKSPCTITPVPLLLREKAPSVQPLLCWRGLQAVWKGAALQCFRCGNTVKKVQCVAHKVFCHEVHLPVGMKQWPTLQKNHRECFDKISLTAHRDKSLSSTCSSYILPLWLHSCSRALLSIPAVLHEWCKTKANILG